MPEPILRNSRRAYVLELKKLAQTLAEIIPAYWEENPSLPVEIHLKGPDEAAQTYLAWQLTAALISGREESLDSFKTGEASVKGGGICVLFMDQDSGNNTDRIKVVVPEVPNKRVIIIQNPGRRRMIADETVYNNHVPAIEVGIAPLPENTTEEADIRQVEVQFKEKITDPEGVRMRALVPRSLINRAKHALSSAALATIEL